MKYAIFAGLLCCVAMTATEARAARPNILFIMVDDLGKEWISCYGADDIKKPNIDALAKGGMKFHNAWSMPQCTPTRVTLLTGQYPCRTGWVNHWDVPRSECVGQKARRRRQEEAGKEVTGRRTSLLGLDI